MVVKESLGKVTIHTDVLHTIVRMATLATPGVARFSKGFSPGGIPNVLSPEQHKGVRIQVEENSVCIDLYIVADSEVSIFRLGRDLQREVGRAIEKMVGMEVAEVNVYVEDVDLLP